MKKLTWGCLSVITALMLTGCGEVKVYDVDTRFSSVVQVEPVSKAHKTVFIRIKDITGHASELSSVIEQQLKGEGYVVVADPEAATFKLMVTVVKFGGGTSNDEITFMQAIDPAKAAELSIEKNRVRTIRRNANAYNKQHPGMINNPYGQRSNDTYVDDTVIEESSIRSFAHRVAIADIEVISKQGRNQKTRVMVGVNMLGGLFVDPKPDVDRFGWTRLIQRLAAAVVSIF